MNRAKCAQPWPHGQAVKTPPFHGGNMGSSPVGVTTKTSEKQLFSLVFASYSGYFGSLPPIFPQNNKNKKSFFVRRLAAFFFFGVAEYQLLPRFRGRLFRFRELVGFMQPVRSSPCARSLFCLQNNRPIKTPFLQMYTTVSFRRRRER